MCLERQIHVRLSAILQLIAIKWRYMHTHTHIHTYGNKHVYTCMFYVSKFISYRHFDRKFKNCECICIMECFYKWITENS